MDEIRRTHFVYCVKRIKSGQYVLLNRHYKPIGQIDRAANANYEDHAIKLRITQKIANRLSWEEKTSIDEIFLYNDDCIPTATTANMESYLKKLAILMKKKLK